MPISRRDFLKSGAAAIAGLTIAPSSILGKSHGHISPTDKLNIGVVGIGGIGHSNINAVKGTENIVALCDVNWDYAKGVFDEFPKAKRFWDYRKMYEEMGKSMDAVIIATADHTHAIITADAMTLGKHVYCQKPLTHSVYESRLLTKLAKSTGVATQMGNQGASWDGTQTVCDWIWNGEIGEVTRVDCATDRPIWPQGLNEPETVDDIPASLNWISSQVLLASILTAKSISHGTGVDGGTTVQALSATWLVTSCISRSRLCIWAIPQRLKVLQHCFSTHALPRHSTLSSHSPHATICQRSACPRLRFTGMTAA